MQKNDVLIKKRKQNTNQEEKNKIVKQEFTDIYDKILKLNSYENIKNLNYDDLNIFVKNIKNADKLYLILRQSGTLFSGNMETADNFNKILEKCNASLNCKFINSIVLLFINNQLKILSPNLESIDKYIFDCFLTIKDVHLINDKLIDEQLAFFSNVFFNKYGIVKNKSQLTLKKFDKYISFVCDSYNKINNFITNKTNSHDKNFQFVKNHIKNELMKNEFKWITDENFYGIKLLFLLTDLTKMKNKINIKYCNNFVTHVFNCYFKIINMCATNDIEKYKLDIENYRKLPMMYPPWLTTKCFELSNKLGQPDGDTLKTTINGPYFNVKSTDNVISNDFKITHKIAETSESIRNKTIIKFDKELQIIREKINLGIDKKKYEIYFKTTETQKAKALSNIGKVIRCVKEKIILSEIQKQIIFKWMKECDILYDFLLEKNKKKEIDAYNILKNKLKIFDELYGKNKKNAPYDVLTFEYTRFCSNVKSCITQLKEGYITHFEMKKRIHQKSQSIMIPKSAMKEDSFYKDTIGKINGCKFENIGGDCMLIYDVQTKNFYMSIPKYVNKIIDEVGKVTEIKKKKQRRVPKKEKNVEEKEIKLIIAKEKEEIAVLDSGEKIFQGYYSLTNGGHIGSNMRYHIQKIQSEIQKIQKNMSRTNKNKRNRRIKIQILYNRIKNIVKELHNKVALYLCKNYKKIVIPIFKTCDMVSEETRKNLIKKKTNEYYTNLYASFFGIERKNELKKYRKRKKLNKRTKFVLMMESHYSFRQHLITKADEYGCEVIVVTEEYTSKTCGNCFKLSGNYNNRVKQCPHCNCKLDRDISAPRVSLIMNNDKINKK